MDWIDIKEKQPNQFQVVEAKYEVWRYHSKQYEDEGEFKYEGWSDFLCEPIFEHYFDDCKVYFTHWRPTVEAPKPE